MSGEPGGGIILDLGLPGIDGTEVIVQLRRWYHAPIIVLSGGPVPVTRSARWISAPTTT